LTLRARGAYHKAPSATRAPPEPQEKAATMPAHAPFRLLALAACAAALAACAAPAVLGAGAAAGYVGLQERPPRQVATDSDLKLSIKKHLAQQKFAYVADVGVDVYYNDVLLTGVVPTAAEGDKVVALARNTEGTRKIYNELFVGTAYGVGQRAKDTWIAAQLQPRLIGTRDVYPLNYLVTVANAHVYIMGTAGTGAEKQNVLHLLSTTPGVAQVHDYLTVRGGAEDGRTTTVTPGAGGSGVRNPNPLVEDLGQ